MRFQERDESVLSAIQEYDGVLARRHIKYVFWPSKGWRAMENRLSKLHNDQYIEWPNNMQRKNFPIPEPIIWLGWKGALFLAGRQGIRVNPPKTANENQLRILERQLRASGFAWYREPHWSNLKHDLTVVDTRFWVLDSLKDIADYSLEEWINESVFRTDTDYIVYQVKTREGEIMRKRKGICPDGAFTLIDKNRKQQGEAFRARFLIEVDMATHDNPSFGMDKAAPGAAYIKSQEYQARFNSNSGRWLVITTSPIRLRNLIQQTRERIGEESNLFYFTTFENCRGHNFFTEPIWYQFGSKYPVPLLKT